MGEMKTLLALLLLVFVCLNNQNYYRVEGGRSISIEEEEEDLELERQFKILNKPAIKTIKTEAGDVYDCVDIHQQPALDHPELKNHKVMTRPSSYPEGLFDERPLPDGFVRAELQSIGCPEGSVPILRVGKEELRATKYFYKSIGLNGSVHPQAGKFPGAHQAVLTLDNPTGTIYRGVRGMMSAHNLTVAPNHYSTTQVWVSACPDTLVTSIGAGWMVAPTMYGDGRPRFFIYRGADITKGCFNRICGGFVLSNKDFSVPMVLSSVSVYGGPQYGVDIAIYQEKASGFWWVNINNKQVGYWPQAFVPSLRNGGKNVAWGGLTLGPVNEPTSPLGNGHYPEAVRNKACAFINMKVIDENTNMLDPPDTVKINVDCFYSVNVLSSEPNVGYNMLYGGPGGNC